MSYLESSAWPARSHRKLLFSRPPVHCILISFPSVFSYLIFSIYILFHFSYFTQLPQTYKVCFINLYLSFQINACAGPPFPTPVTTFQL